jgi:EpsI family protein
MNAAPPRPGALHWVLLTAVAAAIAVASWPALRGMAYMWSNSPMYSFGWVVPAISGWLLWSQRDRLAAAAAAPAPATGLGLGTLALWALMIVTGRAGGILLLEQLAIPVGLAGLVLLFLGRAALAASWVAIAYLLLGVPLWDVFTEPLHLRFQLLSARLAVSLLQAIGIPVFGAGTFIDLPTMRIEVARACSGVNYLIAVLALGIPLAYLSLRTWWRRVVLIAGAMAIAALSNSLRVALICILVYYDLGAPLHGPAHMLHGLFVSAIGHVALFVGLWWLRRAEPPAAGGPVPVAAVSAPAAPGRVPTLVAGALLAWAPVAWIAVGTPAPVALVSGLEGLPARLGPWEADPFASPAPPDWFPAGDQQLVRQYRAGGTAIDVFVGYFERQAQSHEVVSYRAAAFHRAARPLTLPAPAGPLTVNLWHGTADAESRVALFWYEIDGATEARPLAVKLRTLWHAVGRRRSNGAIICLEARSAEGTSRETVEGALGDLASRVHEALAASLPGREDAGSGAASASRRVPSATAP